MEQVRQGKREQFLESYLPKLLAPSSFQQSSLVQEVQAMNQQATDQGIIDALQAMRDRPDSRPTLATIHVPTLVLVGAQDSLTPPAMAETIHQGISGSELVEIPNAGHLTPLEDPSTFNAALLSFIDRRTIGQGATSCGPKCHKGRSPEP